MRMTTNQKNPICVIYIYNCLLVPSSTAAASTTLNTLPFDSLVLSCVFISFSLLATYRWSPVRLPVPLCLSRYHTLPACLCLETCANAYMSMYVCL